MKCSEAWLKEYLNFPLARAQLLQQLTASGLEVDAVTPVAHCNDREIIVVQVVQREIILASEHQCLLTVDTGNGLQAAYANSAQIQVGEKLGFAPLGCQLAGGQLSSQKLPAGELQGKIVTSSDLGIDDEDRTMVLYPEAPLGCALLDYLELDDVVIDIDLTPNRGDCLSILGVARELSLVNRHKAEFTVPEVTFGEVATVPEVKL